MKLLYLGVAADVPYIPRLKGLVGSAQVWVLHQEISTLVEIVHFCKKREITGCFTSSTFLLKKLIKLELGRKEPNLSNYAGSLLMHEGITFTFIPPLEWLIKVSYGTFFIGRIIGKLTKAEEWNVTSKFNWQLANPANLPILLDRFESATCIAIDIETRKQDLSISCIGYCAMWLNPGSVPVTECLVIPIDSGFNLEWMRRFNNLAPAKIFQNGKYDIAYLSRYSATPVNYVWDTAHLFHSYYSELPKDLGFLAGFCIREAMYWKDLSATGNLEDFYRYNALDCWSTAEVFLQLMREMPAWAKENYCMEFPLVFPCHMAEMTGMLRDFQRLEESFQIQQAVIDKEYASLRKMVGEPNFNSNSPNQVKALLKILGCGDLPNTEESNLKKAMFRHPLNAKIIGKIVKIREARKLNSTYLVKGKELSDGSATILYSLNPHGTDTGRLASSEHHFWCGLNVQNIPRGDVVKRTIKAYPGFRFAECDLEQAESRDTAHIAGDTALISAVSGERDFHSINAAAFFGTPYEQIYDDRDRKVCNKTLRDLAKRVNHGANYLMGAAVLVDTMGLDKIEEARSLLHLNKLWTHLKIAEYLLEQFHKTYPALSRIFYPGVAASVRTTKMLVSAPVPRWRQDTKLQHEYRWTRYCFGDPAANKRDLNAYVAHQPQNLNAMALNTAFMRVFYEVALPHSENFKLCAQIHDSILFQFREGHEHLCQLVREKMEIPLKVKGYDGVVREYYVPAAIKAGKDGKGSIYWSEIE